VCGLTAITAVTAAACSSSTASTANTDVTIAWIPKEVNNPVFDLGKQGAFKAAADLTASSGRKVNVLYLGPEGSNASEKIDSQIALVKQAVTQKVSAISISCNDAVKLQSSLDDAVAAGIPVMTWDSDSPASRRYTYYGMDNKAGGTVAARLLAKILGDSGSVAVISGTRGAANLDQRVDGFYEEITTNHTSMSVISKEYCDDDPPTCAAKIETVMKANPNLKGWFFAGLWALTTTSTTNPSETAMPTWEAASKGGTVKTIVFDTLPFELDLMKAGKVHGLIGQKYYGWGYDSVGISFDRVTQNKQFQEFTDSKFDVVCPNNVDQMKSMWDAQDFTKTLPDCDLLNK